MYTITCRLRNTTKLLTYPRKNQILKHNPSSRPINSDCNRMNLQLHHHQRSIVASLGNGRLGNQMSNFASCYAVMREYGMYPYLNPSQLHALQKVFILPRLSKKGNQSYYLWEKGKL